MLCKVSNTFRRVGGGGGASLIEAFYVFSGGFRDLGDMYFGFGGFGRV